MMMGMVCEMQRKHNAKAAEEMIRWRHKYNILTDAIQRSKARIRTARRFNNVNAELAECMALKVLGQRAAVMMQKRKGIKTLLRCTAYAYATQEAS